MPIPPKDNDNGDLENNVSFQAIFLGSSKIEFSDASREESLQNLPQNRVHNQEEDQVSTPPRKVTTS